MPEKELSQKERLQEARSRGADRGRETAQRGASVAPEWVTDEEWAGMSTPEWLAGLLHSETYIEDAAHLNDAIKASYQGAADGAFDAYRLPAED